jgi:inward rectifier potassium channel
VADRIRKPVRREARSRLFGDRIFVAENLKQNPWADLYHTAMVMTWPRFLGAMAGLFLGLNVLFAAVYSLGRDPIANARPGTLDLLFFSVETLSTTGYGDMHPQTVYGHLVATVEIFVSLISTAAMTGLIFARFSRPRARLIFASEAVIVPHDGVDTVCVRIVNARDSFISEAAAKMWWLAPSVTTEGRRYTGFSPMPLLKSENPAFALSWTLFHPIDANSPLYGKSPEQAAAEDVRLVVSITGLDETSSQLVHARHVYAAKDLRWGHEFVDMFRRDENGRAYVDFAKVHDTRLASL